MTTPEAQLAVIVNRVVASYSRRCWWADPDDLRQQAWVHATKARKRWNPDAGPIDRYAGRAIKRAVTNLLIKESSPVSAPWHRRHETIGLRRAPVDDAGLALASAPGTWAETLLADVEWRARVTARLLEVVGSAEAVADLCGEGEHASAPPQIRRRLREKIAGDVVLRKLWEER